MSLQLQISGGVIDLPPDIDVADVADQVIDLLAAGEEWVRLVGSAAGITTQWTVLSRNPIVIGYREFDGTTGLFT